jgi:hypothetical protein
MSTEPRPGRRTRHADSSEIETIAKWRSLLEGLESESVLGIQRTSCKRRLMKMRDEITQIARDEARSLCNCQQITVAESRFWEEFEAKMNISCPIHGPCRLGLVVTVMGYSREGDPGDRRLAQLLREYRRRYLSHRNAESKPDETTKASL